MQRWVKDLNRVYREERAMHRCDFNPEGFEWIDCNDGEQSSISFIRKDETGSGFVLVVCNFTPVPRFNYRVGVPKEGYWRELLNSDAKEYGGSGLGNAGGVHSSAHSVHGRPHSIEITLPPLGMCMFRVEAAGR